jgi:tetratricopeptide (TPR) repeat protein
MTDPELDAPADPQERGESFLHSGMRLLEEGDLLQAMGMFRQAVVELEDLPQSDGRDRALALAWYSSAFIHGNYGQIDEEIALCDRIVSLFTDSRDSEVRCIVALALFRKAFSFTQRGTLEDAARAHAEVVARFADAQEPQIRLCVATALYNSGLAQGRLGHPEEELRDYDRLVTLFGSDSDPSVRRKVALTLGNKVAVMCQLGRQDEVILVTDELLRRFGADPVLRPIVALALRNKGNIFEHIAWTEAASDVYAELVARFAMDDQPKIVEQLTFARERMAVLRTRQR